MDSIKEWMAFIGRRNIAYVVFVSLLVPFGMLMEAAGPQGPDSGGGIMAAIILWTPLPPALAIRRPPAFMAQ